MPETKKKSTSFRFNPTTIEKLHYLKKEINKKTLIRLSHADIIEILVNRASAEDITKKINNL